MNLQYQPSEVAKLNQVLSDRFSGYVLAKTFWGDYEVRLNGVFAGAYDDVYEAYVHCAKAVSASELANV